MSKMIICNGHSCSKIVLDNVMYIDFFYFLTELFD